VEPQLRGVLHTHAVWDEPRIPYDLIHKVWNRISGYAWVEPVTSHCGVADYVSKYAVKGGLVSTYVTRQLRAVLDASPLVTVRFHFMDPPDFNLGDH